MADLIRDAASPSTFSAVQAVAANTLTEIVRFTIDPLGGKRAVVTVSVGAGGGSLTALQLRRSARRGGVEVLIADTADWQTLAGSPTATVLGVYPATAATTAAGNSFQLDLAGPGEFALYGTVNAAATLSVQAAMG